MPGWLLDGLGRQMPALQAEERLEAYGVLVAAGGRQVKESAHSEMVRRWQRAASGGRRRAQRARSLDELVQQAESIGVKVVRQGVA